MCEDAAPEKRPRSVGVSSNRRCFNWNLNCLLLFLYYWLRGNQMRPKKQNLVWLPPWKFIKPTHDSRHIKYVKNVANALHSFLWNFVQILWLQHIFLHKNFKIVVFYNYSQTRSSVPVANELMNSFTEKWFRLLIQ